MSQCHVKFLINCLDFDGKTIKEARKDKLAAFRDVFETSITNCRNYMYYQNLLLLMNNW